MTQTPESQTKHNDNAPFYRQPIFWMLMSGSILVVIAAFVSFGIAKTHAQDMVSDDYYKDGKHINLQIDRDNHALERNISAQVMFNPEGSAVKVFVNGQFEAQNGVKLLLLHPTRQDEDRTIELKAINGNEFAAQFEPLPPTVHWYIRVEDGQGVWRVQEKWLPNQGGAVMLKAQVPTLSVSAPQSVD
nr:FixH family protein [Alysiella crassa]UOP05986.1 FixH family protein [Alysiella crassa]